MKHLKRFNEDIDTPLEVTECMLGATHTVSDTNISYVINGEEYSFTLRESGDISGNDYTFEFLPDHDLPFEITEEMKDKMWSMYEQEASK